MIGPADVPPGPDPVDDPGRIAEVAALGLAGTPDAALQGALDRAAGDAATALGLPIALVSVVLDAAQVNVAAHGVAGAIGWMAESGGFPVEWSFCRRAVVDRAAFVVEDATVHPQVRDNPLVTLGGMRSYAGVPLVTSRGHAVGALCVIGTEPRAFGAADIARLEAGAADVVRRLERAAGRTR